MKNIKNKFIRIISSDRGMAAYIIMFCLIPLLLMVPAIAIDISTYLATRNQLQNALDISAITALNNSTDDTYRADKIIRVIVNANSQHDFNKNLKASIEKNLSTTAEFESGNRNSLTLTPGLPMTPYISTLNINMQQVRQDPKTGEYTGTDTTSKDVADSSGESNKSFGADYDITLTLTSYVDLPVFKKVTDFFTLRVNKDMFKVPITVKSAIRGLRVKSSEDFRLLQFEEGY